MADRWGGLLHACSSLRLATVGVRWAKLDAVQVWTWWLHHHVLCVQQRLIVDCREAAARLWLAGKQPCDIDVLKLQCRAPTVDLNSGALRWICMLQTWTVCRWT